MTRVDTRSGEPVQVAGRWYRPNAFYALLDGEDVSDRCFLADDEIGEVGLYKRDAGGRFYVEPGTDEPAVEFRRGVVTIIPPKEAA